MTGLTAATLRAGMGGPLSLARYEQLLPSFTRFLLAANCTTVRRAAMAIAQTGHESVGLRYAREIWGPNAQQRKYGQIGGGLAKQLGNTKPSDGYDMRGAGWLQVTGRANFGAASRWAHERGYVPTPTFFVDHPDLLGDDRYVWIGPAWYWTAARPKLNAACDAGSVETATRLINGGRYGLEDRRRRYEACLRLGDRLLPAAASPARPVAPPKPKALPDMIDRPIYPAPHAQTGRIVCPVGASSATVGRAWFSASFDGGARVEAWFQKAAAGSDAAAPGSGKPIDWTLRNAERPWVEVPSGTEFIQYRVTNAEGAGALSVELAPK